MRDTSLSISKQNSHQPKQYQGGEKKVMKKSLSLLLAIAMVFSMFASVAFAANTPQTALEKFNALKDKGIFTGINDAGDPGLDQQMTRAQAAVVIAKLFGLDTSTPPATATFKDVPTTHWANAYVEAAVKAGIIHGVSATKYSDKSQVTTEQLATMLVLGLGLQVDANATVQGSASAWAQKYVAAAVANNLLPAADSYKQAALREALVNASYSTYVEVEAAKQPATVGVASLTATGAKVLTVTFTGAVDKTKAALALTRNGTAVSDVTTAFADDAKSATLTLNTKINEATYAVTLSGIDNLDSEKASASVDAKVEMIKTIDITTASDTLPLANGVKVEFVAKNQYGEKTDLSAGSFTFSTGGVTYTTVSGEQAIKLDLSGKAKGDKVPVTVIYSDSNSTAQANKIFTVGEAPIVSKVEVGDLMDADGNMLDSIEAGKTAYVDIKAYDQYGVRVSDAATLNDGGKGVTVVIPDSDLLKGTSNTVTTNPAFVASVVGDYGDDAAFSAKSGASAKDVTVTFFANGTGQSVSKVIHISTPAVPATVEFGNYTDTIAKDDAPVFIPLVVKDASGKLLTAQQIADNASKFTTYAIGGQATIPADGSSTVAGVSLNVTNGIQTTGSDKGKLALSTFPNTGNGQVVVMLKDYPTQKSTFNVAVNAARVADHISVSEAAAAKLINGATSELKFKTYDQYNGDWKNTTTTVTDYVYLKLEKVSGTGVGVTTTGAASLAVGGTVKLAASSVFDTAINWVAPASGGEGTYKLTATLYKINSSGPDTELSNVTSTIEVTDGKSLTLTYAVAADSVTNNTLFSTNVTGTTYGNYAAAAAAYPLYGKAIKVTAKDSNGNTVALPSVITQITSSNSSIVATDGSGHVIGLADGTASISVVFTTPNGASASNLNLTVTKDVPVVATMTGDKTSNSALTADISNGGAGIYAWNAKLFNKLTIDDQYGTEYVQDATHNDVMNAAYGLHLIYYISDIKHHGTESNDTVTVNSTTGLVQLTSTGTADIASFVLHALAPNGKDVSVEITVD